MSASEHMPDDPSPSADQDDDDNLFSRMIGEVTPVRKQDHLGHRLRKKPKARRRKTDHDVMRQLRDDPFLGSDVDVGDELRYTAEKTPAHVLKDLRRGRFRIDEEIDLHGLPEHEARPLLHDFLNECRLRHRATCLAVIHGKGLRSADAPVLKRMVDGYLRRRSDVLAFSSATSKHGGTGVTWVLLKARH